MKLRDKPFLQKLLFANKKRKSSPNYKGPIKKNMANGPNAPVPHHIPDPARESGPMQHQGMPRHAHHQFASPEMQHHMNNTMAVEEATLGSAIDPGFEPQNEQQHFQTADPLQAGHHNGHHWEHAQKAQFQHGEQYHPQHQSAPDMIPPMEVELPPDWPVEKELVDQSQEIPATIYNRASEPAPSPILSPTKQPQPIAEGWLSVQSVFKSYKKRPVVRDVSLNVRRGESVGLLGPNGAGKTTVFYMITGLVPADQGGIFIDGFDVTKLPMYRRSRLGIGYLPQEASIFRGLSVEDNIMAVLQVVEKSAKKRRHKLDSLLEEFNIERLRKSPSIALSGGERRRCEIARALASDPSYMLLDEPFAGIDPIAIGDIRELVRHLTERGIGVLITDHNVRETLSMIDRAYIIHDGNVLMEGAPDEIIANEDVRRVYLGDMFA